MYFDDIVPCGIKNKQVTSLARELGRNIDLAEVKKKLKSILKKFLKQNFLDMQELS